MSKNRQPQPKVTTDNKPVGNFYKSYDIKWLRQNPDHVDYYLVKEYDELVVKGGEK